MLGWAPLGLDRLSVKVSSSSESGGGWSGGRAVWGGRVAQAGWRSAGLVSLRVGIRGLLDRLSILVSSSSLGSPGVGPGQTFHLVSSSSVALPPLGFGRALGQTFHCG